jgi:hypothetical protein
MSYRRTTRPATRRSPLTIPGIKPSRVAIPDMARRAFHRRCVEAQAVLRYDVSIDQEATPKTTTGTTHSSSEVPPWT